MEKPTPYQKYKKCVLYITTPAHIPSHHFDLGVTPAKQWVLYIMVLTNKVLPVSKIVATTLAANAQFPAKSGYSIGGVWLNGYSQEDYPTPAEVHAALMGKELSPSRTGKSLVVVGEFTPIERDTDLLTAILTPRAPQVNVEALNLNDLI